MGTGNRKGIETLKGMTVERNYSLTSMGKDKERIMTIMTKKQPSLK